MATTDSPGDSATQPLASAQSRVALWAAALAASAGLVHALAGEGHFSEWWGYGVFFLAVSICQFCGGAALLFWNERQLYWTGIVGTAIVLLIWTASRTVGVPIGPDGAGPERIGVLDGISLVLEVGLIWCLARLLRHPEPAPLESLLTEDDDANS